MIQKLEASGNNYERRNILGGPLRAIRFQEAEGGQKQDGIPGGRNIWIRVSS